MTPDEIAIRAGKDIKIIWPDGMIEYREVNRARGVTRVINGVHTRPTVQLYIGPIPDQYYMQVRLLANLVKANVYIPATMAKL